MVKQDWECYYDRYKDLQDALPKTKEAMVRHYNNYGKNPPENRLWSCTDNLESDIKKIIKGRQEVEEEKDLATTARLRAEAAKTDAERESARLASEAADARKAANEAIQLGKDNADELMTIAANAEATANNAKQEVIEAANAIKLQSQQSQQLVSQSQNDLDQVKNIINTLGYTGFNAGQIFLEETALNKRLDLIEKQYRTAIELQLYHFKLEKEKYFDNFEDDELKFKALNDMFLYMIDYYIKYNKSYYDDSNTTLLFLNYIINKSGYNKSGVQTKEYELYTSSVALKQKLFIMENFTNMSNITNSANNILSKIKHSFTNIIEGNTPMSGPQREGYTNPSDFIGIIRNILSKDVETISKQKQELQTNINYIKRFQDGEFLAQRDTIMNNVLMDYMINNKEGSNIEQVYEKLNQEKNDKLRKTKIAAYYTKSFKEYIYLLKIVIFLIVLMIPILIFNRLEILDKSLTLLLVVTIITLGFLYLSYRLYILYMRDSKDFDKFKIPFTRTEAANFKSKGSRYSKDSPLKSLGITCVGEECCDASMVYDKLRDKCVATENFGNYFENAQQLNNQQKNIIKENNSHEDESNFSFLGGNADIIENFRSKEGIKRDILLDSLKNSSITKF